MKRYITALALGLASVLALGAVAYAGNTDDGTKLSGKHYNLNIIGVENPKNNNLNLDAYADPNNGKVIFVALNNLGGTSTKILLKEAPDATTFDVLDPNGTDGQASFMLPNPDENMDGTTDYSVFIRALGSPKGSAVMQSCYVDKVTGDTWCAADIAGGVSPVPLQHISPSKFTNVSKDLLYVDVCDAINTTTGACTTTHIEPLFGPSGSEYYWDYANKGLRLAQLRFYDMETVAWDPSKLVDPLP